MTVAEYDIPAIANDTLRFFIDFFEDEDQTDPYNLSQFSEYKMQIKTTSNNPAFEFELSLGQGLTISNTNRMSFEVDKTQMDLVARNYVYDLEGNNEPGDRRTILEGLFKVQQDVTR